MSDRLLALKIDFHDASQIEEAVAVAVATFGQVDMLINNAGHALLRAVEEASDAATKFAVERLSQVLAQEIAPLGIGMTIVEPERFRKDVLGAALTIVSKTIDDYATTTGVIRAKQKKIHGRQQGDPALEAQAIIKAGTSENPPPHLLLGPDVDEAAMEQVNALQREFET